MIFPSSKCGDTYTDDTVIIVTLMVAEEISTMSYNNNFTYFYIPIKSLKEC